MKVTVRNENSGDIGAIDKVTAEAFLNAPHTNHTEQYIVLELRKSDDLYISLVAEHQGKVIGHVAISPVTISDGATAWFGLGPISVSIIVPSAKQIIMGGGSPSKSRSPGSRILTRPVKPSP